ncbi:hypothetical protein F5Y15DRAFT_163087 [Xylariaceae sp. FL0016]|nr:hypothetical protein F5Y15DRAFT_163087 [Xylariaceae sp. FL0016]
MFTSSGSPMSSSGTRIGILQAVSNGPIQEAAISRRWIAESEISSFSAKSTLVDDEFSIAIFFLPWERPTAAGQTNVTEAMECLGFDNTILQRWSEFSGGWDFFRGTDDRHCFLVHTPLYKLAWSFDPVLMKTRALLLAQSDFHASAFFNSDTILSSDALVMDHICHPMFFAKLALLDILRYLRERVAEQTQVVQTLDVFTGHGIWVGDEGIPKTPDAMIAASKKVGGTVIRLAHMSRSVEVADSITSTIADTTRWRRQDSKFSEQFETCADVLDAAVPYYRQDILMVRLTIKTLDEIAKTLSTIISSLLSREDTRQSNELALISKEIAEAAKQDSTAMKTIAIMTMAFLPATFFAALFAVPSLQWDRKSIVTDRFWIYWAFTLPATLLVFLVWYLTTNFRYPFSGHEPPQFRLPTVKHNPTVPGLFQLSEARNFPEIPGESMRNPDLSQLRRNRYKSELDNPSSS